ncbi:MAG: BREX-1 system adenine-specific DNA-methyltransferase PglX, partial [Clostridiaceae bacterium]|nr:BREX-1 system adenine-specific DNA-methyltransferase PglX [Clostridiaceae bacterium]
TYHVVVTNPPYMGASNMGSKLSSYVKKNYPNSKSDMFAVLIERCAAMTKANYFQAMITQHVWMFLKSYEKLRANILFLDIVNMAHLGARAFEEIGGEVVQTTSFVLRKSRISNYQGVYRRLIDSKSHDAKEQMFISGENEFVTNQDNYSKISGSPIAYWANDKIFEAFSNGDSIDKISDFTGSQNITGNNNLFLRSIWEINKTDIHKKGRWVFYAKGGDFRRWYGHILLAIDVSPSAINYYKTNPNSNYLKHKYWFTEGITYTAVTSLGTGFRYFPAIGGFDKGGPTICYVQHFDYVLGFLNTKIVTYLLNVLNPTLNIQVRDVKALPFYFEKSMEKIVGQIVGDNVRISRTDWNAFETSWDFQRHPLVRPVDTIAEAFRQWQDECEDRFTQLKANEEELNRIFIDIYGLENELTPEVDDKEVTVARVYDTKDDVPDSMKGNLYVRTKEDDIKSFISYAVGCMFGRFSLDWDGLVYAGGDWDESKYQTFIPSPDNCILITEEAYFEDDIVARFIDFVRVVFGNDTLEKNLDFIADALGRKGNSSREIIRRYFLKDFYKDHVKTYQKRPIYWLFDSGRQDGFKALVYIHRWNADTTGNIRVSHLHRVQRIYESELKRLDDIVANSEHNRDKRYAEKQKNKLIKQIKETREYDEKIAHLANARIDIDLDDGVRVNHAKVQTSATVKNIKILANI